MSSSISVLYYSRNVYLIRKTRCDEELAEDLSQEEMLSDCSKRALPLPAQYS